MKTIFFVRHGLSTSNVNETISGAEDDCDLTDEGRRQAKRAGRDLKNKGTELIVSSPMKRTMETARIIAKSIGYDLDKIVPSDLFIERTYGVYSGRPASEYWSDEEAGQAHPSVESTEAMHRRFRDALDWLRSRPESRIVVVSHGGASRALRVINDNLHHSHMYKLDTFPNGDIYEFVLQ